ncbi:hypothetical protein EDD37DRAFT_606290 [Exophiala viscosa]|uniref:Uncharacterized protein n=1 Tax=Exophiala viscosa TaxID=2486360 RepID=A0AAN6E791_9EURO|nr:hypothetical protein EDD36DRAFT_459998 [Exophiala viscosa]KAI1627478.1 hypothetical protein EDD37DRAFT_606290 [Exophiala viscosa]
MLDEDVSPESEEDKSHTYPLALPPLSPTPLNHSDCCLGLSTTLVQCILDILHPKIPSLQIPALPVLSIGSGTGLFEALLTTLSPRGTIEVHGVEVSSSSSANKYLSLHLRHTVPTTFTLYDDATHFPVWIFVYPRDPRLVRVYLELAAASGRQVTLIFLGPKADFLPASNSEGEDGDGEAQQDTFADVLGSFSDHMERCHDFIEHDETTGPVCNSGDGAAFSKPFRASIFSSADAGLPSYEVLCVLRV